MQPVRLAVPEFDRLRRETEPGPERRTRHGLILVFRVVLSHSGFEIARRFHRPALPGRPRAQLAHARPRREVRISLRDTHRSKRSLHANLTLERLPVEAQRRATVEAHVARLAALEIRVEDEA